MAEVIEEEDKIRGVKKRGVGAAKNMTLPIHISWQFLDFMAIIRFQALLQIKPHQISDIKVGRARIRDQVITRFDELTGPITAFLVRRCKTSLKVRPLVVPSSSSASSTPTSSSSSVLSLATKGSIAHRIPEIGQETKEESLTMQWCKKAEEKQLWVASCKWRGRLGDPTS